MTSLQHMRRLHTGRARSSHDIIARTIGMEILGGAYAPGTNLPQEAVLLKRFRISRTVLREVMKTLSAKGLVVLKTRIGTRVLNSSSWNLFDAELLAWRVDMGLDEKFRRELAEIRLAVEPASAALAAGRRTQTQLRQLRDCVRRMADSLGDRDRFAEADVEFHQLIGVATGDLEETAAGLAAIVDAFAAMEAARASAAMVRVISLGQARIAAGLRAKRAVPAKGGKKTRRPAGRFPQPSRR